MDVLYDSDDSRDKIDRNDESTFRRELENRLKCYEEESEDSISEKGGDEIDFELSEQSNRNRQLANRLGEHQAGERSVNMKVRDVVRERSNMAAGREAEGGGLPPTSPRSTRSTVSRTSSNEDMSSINRRVVELVMKKMPDKYRKRDKISTIGFACTVANEYDMSLVEEEAFARYLHKETGGSEWVDFHVLSRLVKGNVGVHAVREAMKVLYEKKIADAMERLRLSGKIFEEAEAFYHKVKSTEDNLSKRSSHLKQTFESMKNRLSAHAEALFSSNESEIISRLTSTEGKLQVLEKKSKNYADKKRFDQMKSFLKTYKEKLTEAELEIVKLNIQLQQALKNARTNAKLAMSRENKSHSSKKQNPHDSFSKPDKTQTETEDKKRSKDAGSQTNEKKFMKYCFNSIFTTLKGGFISQSLLLLYRISEQDFQIDDKTLTDILKSQEVCRYLTDSNLFDILSSNKKPDPNWLKLLLKLMLDKVVKRQDNKYLHDCSKLSLVIWLNDQSLIMEDEQLAEQSVILLEKASYIASHTDGNMGNIDTDIRAGMKRIIKKYDAMVCEVDGKWRHNTFITSNIKVIHINI